MKKFRRVLVLLKLVQPSLQTPFLECILPVFYHYFLTVENYSSLLGDENEKMLLVSFCRNLYQSSWASTTSYHSMRPVSPLRDLWILFKLTFSAHLFSNAFILWSQKWSLSSTGISQSSLENWASWAPSFFHIMEYVEGVLLSACIEGTARDIRNWL